MADLPSLVFLLGRLARLNESVVGEICADHGTTPAEVRVLSLLVHRPDRSASPSDIATFVVQTSGGLTATLRRLEGAGLIERVADPDDGRGRLVVLTGPGEHFHTTVIGRLVERIGAALSGIDLDLADEQIRALVEAFESAAGLPSSAGFQAGVPVSVPTR